MAHDDIVEEVRARADIVEIIGQFVSLRKAGREFRGLSPFKKEKTPSFFVIPAKGFFHDFSSGESGDVFAFLMKHQGMSFLDAVRHVGAHAGVDVSNLGRRRKKDDPARPYHEACAYASSFFRERLWDAVDGAKARAYLEGRGIGRETAERFGLGYAPDRWEALREAASVHGLSEPLLVEIGLLKEAEGRDRPYDGLRDRITFPIESLSGRVVAFGGRLLGREGKGRPKYLNSPESPIFRKGEVLYGLRRARNHIRRSGSALVVEGFVDVVSLSAAEIGSVVAPLGTALTDGQARLLRRFTDQACLLFDSDAAGLRATFRAADTLLAHGVSVSVAMLPEGEDPDSLVRGAGRESLLECVQQSVDVLDRKIGILEEHGYFDSTQGRRRAVDRLLPTIRAALNPRVRDIYATRVAERVGVRRETLLAEVGSLPAPRRAPAARPSSPGRRRQAPRFHGLGPERALLLLLVKERSLVERASEKMGPSDLEDRANRAIFEALVDDPELVTMPEGSEREVVRRFEELSADPEMWVSPAQAFADAVESIATRGIDRQIESIESRLAGASADQKLDMVRRKEVLTQEKLARSVDWRRSARAIGTIGRKAEE
ncbi:MAG: DNA primase [Gemmatimonadetes bacterium]|nr:DNA primase [Gemmatimonadota bacterium]